MSGRDLFLPILLGTLYTLNIRTNVSGKISAVFVLKYCLTVSSVLFFRIH